MLKTCALAAGSLLLLSACGGGSSGSSDGSATTVKVTLDDKGCTLSSTSAPAGAVVFRLTNSGTSKVTEAELMKGDRVLGEKEDVTPGLDGSFTVKVKAGDYTFRCPGGSGPKDQPFTVTSGTTVGSSGPDAAAQTAAATAYAGWVRTQVAEQVVATRKLTDAVRAGDLAAARAAYPGARVNYERIEPVAESFGDLDQALDAREGTVPSGTAWTGYHWLERALFAQRSLTGAAAVADRLDADVARLQQRVATETYDATDLANGASELLSEIGRTKVTGEEERYAHCDFVDFQANVDGARKAYQLLKPALDTRDAALSRQVAVGFAAVDQALQPYRTGTGPADFRAYAATPAEQHALAGAVDGLAEPLSRVAAVLVR